jgi:hypothetical protein
MTPMRREVLLVGKYLVDLLATVVIFTSSTALQWLGQALAIQRQHHPRIPERYRLASVCRLCLGHSPGLCGVWQCLSRRRIARSQSDHSRCDSAAMGECQSVPPLCSQENQHDLLPAIPLPGIRYPGQQPAAHVQPVNLSHGTGHGCHGDYLCSAVDRIGTRGNRPTGTRVGDKLWD